MEEQPTTTTSNPSLATVPQAWSGPFALLGHSKQVVKQNMMPILVLNVLTIIIGGVNSASDRQHNGGFGIVGLAASLLSIWLSLSLIMLYLAGVRSEKMSVTESVSRALKVYLNGLVASILTAILIAISFVALIIPGFFVLPRLALVSYYIADKQLGPIAAIKASWNNTKGHSLKVWGVIAVTVLFAVLIFLLVGIYLLFIYQAATAVLYSFIERQAKTSVAAA